MSDTDTRLRAVEQGVTKILSQIEALDEKLDGHQQTRVTVFGNGTPANPGLVTRIDRLERSHAMLARICWSATGVAISALGAIIFG